MELNLLIAIILLLGQEENKNQRHADTQMCSKNNGSEAVADPGSPVTFEACADHSHKLYLNTFTGARDNYDHLYRIGNPLFDRAF